MAKIPELASRIIMQNANRIHDMQGWVFRENLLLDLTGKNFPTKRMRTIIECDTLQCVEYFFHFYNFQTLYREYEAKKRSEIVTASYLLSKDNAVMTKVYVERFRKFIDDIASGKTAIHDCHYTPEVFAFVNWCVENRKVWDK